MQIQRKPVISSIYAPSPEVRRYTWKAERCKPLMALQVGVVVGVLAVMMLAWGRLM